MLKNKDFKTIYHSAGNRCYQRKVVSQVNLVIPPVVNRLLSVRELRTVAIKHLVELLVEQDFFFATFYQEKNLSCFFFFFFFFFLYAKEITLIKYSCPFLKGAMLIEIIYSPKEHEKMNFKNCTMTKTRGTA